MFKVDPEFKSLIPPLQEDERLGLEADIVRDGRATVPLVVWGELLAILLDSNLIGDPLPRKGWVCDWCPTSSEVEVA